MNLEQTFKQAAYKVWDELEPISNTQHVIFPVREEALTTMALKAMVAANCTRIAKIEMISSDKEKTHGYDFELLIGGNKKWIRFFIQSKRLYGYNITDNYDAIKFDQVNQIIQFSKDNIGIPTYAFYNHLEENDLTLNDHYNSVTPFDRKCLGITFTSALSIQMLKSRKFIDYHFNYGFHLPPSIRPLKSFEHLFYFYTHYRTHLSIPFHDIAYLTIDLAETMNKLYKKRQAKGTLPLFLFMWPGFENFYGDDDLIPIIRDKSLETLTSEFRRRAQENEASNYGYYPKALIAIQTD
jgi:hypothetical protein